MAEAGNGVQGAPGEGGRAGLSGRARQFLADARLFKLWSEAQSTGVFDEDELADLLQELQQIQVGPNPLLE